MPVTGDCDLAIVGSGFGGSILAMIACRLGHRVLLLERGRHPRFAIGESASPLAGVLIEQLADRYDLPRLRPLAAFGPWQRAYPEVTCGLKRGFTYFKHDAGTPYRTAPGRANQLLVAASPADAVSDTHWLRADVDAFLVREASALGVEYLDEVLLDGLERGADGAMRLSGTRRGVSMQLRAGAVIDASGPRGFMSRVVGDGSGAGFQGFPATQALYSHFTGVARCDEMPDFDDPHGETPPYRLDDAALHHVFDGGWMWVLRFGNGVTSAGVAVTDRLASELRLADGAAAWRRLLARYPSMAAQFAGARPIREFTWMPRVAWRASMAAGPGWVRLPSAVASIDALFSTGIPLTLLGIERVAGALARGALEWSGETWLEAYADTTLGEADHTAAFVAGCYAGFDDFAAFCAYSMFYFAAASHAEALRRVRPDAAGDGFLRAADPAFASALRRLSPAVGSGGAGRGDPRFVRDVAAAIEPVNVAGLCAPEKRNWYAVDVEDTVRTAAKLGASPEAVRAALALPLAPGTVAV